MNKRVLVTGSSGQLGQSLQSVSIEYRKLTIDFVNREKLNFLEYHRFGEFFESNHYDVVINCAAYTNVDQAEREHVEANIVNSEAVKELASICKTKNIVIIHISTDYVFNGALNRAYTEEDLTNPVNIYGDSKLKGEQNLTEINPNGLIIRTSWLYSEFCSNFVKTMVKLGKTKKSINVVSDNYGSPTYAVDLARAILEVVSNYSLHGYKIKNNIYHYSNSGRVSWYLLAKKVFETCKLNCKVREIKAADYITVAERPVNTELCTSKIHKSFDLIVHDWDDSLDKCLTKLQCI